MANLYPPFSPLRYYFEAKPGHYRISFWLYLDGVGENTKEKLGSERNNAASFLPQPPPLFMTTILSDTVFRNILRKEAHPRKQALGRPNSLQLPNHLLLPAQTDLNVSAPPCLSSSKDNTGKQWVWLVSVFQSLISGIASKDCIQWNFFSALD